MSVEYHRRTDVCRLYQQMVVYVVLVVNSLETLGVHRFKNRELRISSWYIQTLLSRHARQRYDHIGVAPTTHALRRVCRSYTDSAVGYRDLLCRRLLLNQEAQEVLHVEHQSLVPHHCECARVLFTHCGVVGRHSGRRQVCHSHSGSVAVVSRQSAPLS